MLSRDDVWGHVHKSSCLVLHLQSAEYLGDKQLWMKLDYLWVLIVMNRPTSENWIQYTSPIKALFTVNAQ